MVDAPDLLEHMGVVCDEVAHFYECTHDADARIDCYFAAEHA